MSGQSGGRFKAKHRRLQSAATGAKRYENSQSVRDFVSAAADPRSGVWALKAYKTPIAFHKEGHKVLGMSLKEPVPPFKDGNPKAKFYIKPLKWTEANQGNKF